MIDRKICEVRCYLGIVIVVLMNFFYFLDGWIFFDFDVIEILFFVVLILIKGDIDKKKLVLWSDV